MALISAFVRSPVKVTVGVLMLVLFGLVALKRMPMQLTPEVQRPTITIETRWPGASPQEVEREIIIDQEDMLKSVESVTKMSSESSDSTGRVTLEFKVGTDMDKAVVDVIGRLEQVREYPEDVDKPVISTANAADRPIAWFILSAKRPTPEQFDAFVESHPELKDEIGHVRAAYNPGLIMLRLRTLAEDHPEVLELLPAADFDVTKLRRFAEDKIEAPFERVSGVSQANVIGGLEEELQVIIDPQLLAARQITVEDVRRVLRSQNADVSAGDFWETKRRWVVRTLGQFTSPEQVADQLLAVRDGAPVYVRDVAEVQLGYKKPDGLVRRFGESSIAINAQRETGANVLDVMTGLREVNDMLNEDILDAEGLVLTQVYDETDYIYSAVDLVQQNIFVGGSLTMIVLMGFLHLGVRTMLLMPLLLASSLAAAFVSPWFIIVTLVLIVGAGVWFGRGALVVGMAIPTSIIGTFLVLQTLGRSLNVISLAGLAFAVGMLVDNAVVVLENIYRRYSSMGENPFLAAVRGTQEVWGAVVASTLTTVAVFLPIVFIEEEAGQLFRDIALAISAAVALSMVVSMTLIPTASARLFKSMRPNDGRDPGGQGQKASRLLRPILGLGDAMVRQIVAANRWIQKGVLRRLAVVGLLTGVSLGVSYWLWPKVEYLPTGNRNLVFGILLPPPGYNLDQLMDLGETVESELRPYWDVDPDSEEARSLEYPVVGDFFFVARGRTVFIGLRSYDGDRAGELVPLVGKVREKLPGTFAVAKQSSLFEQGLTAGRTIEVEITGPDLNRLVQLGGLVLAGNPADRDSFPGLLPNESGPAIIPDAQSRPVPSLDLSNPEVHIRPKLVQAADMGVSTSELGYAANALVDGAYSGDYYERGDKIDVTIKGREAFAQNIQSLKAMPIVTPYGQLVPLEALAEVKESSGPEQINHREKLRAITIEVSPPREVPLQEAMAIIQERIVDPIEESGQLKGGYRVTLAGTADKLESTWSALRFNIMLALLITYLLMAALFESWLYPLVVIFSVPLGAVGGVMALSVLNNFYFQPLDVLTMLGFVILIGTVVNNPILIVHQSLNYIRDEGMNPQAAILESLRTRIRPIFMTTTTTILGLLPLVLFPGAGSELYRGLGSVVLGGLAVSTVFTLFLVPSLFSVVMELKMVVTRWLKRRPEKRDGSGTSAPETAKVSQV